MGKRRLCTGVMLGAIIGGLVTLKDPVVRGYAKRKVCETRSRLNSCLKNPAESVRNLRMCVIKYNKDIVRGLDDSINALEQVEQTLEKVITKKDPTQNLLK